MKECSKTCVEKDISCPHSECRLWIDFPQDHNCVLITVDKHGNLPLREVAPRMQMSHVRVKQIQDEAIEKVKKKLKK